MSSKLSGDLRKTEVNFLGCHNSIALGMPFISKIQIATELLPFKCQGHLVIPWPWLLTWDLENKVLFPITGYNIACDNHIAQHSMESSIYKCIFSVIKVVMQKIANCWIKYCNCLYNLLRYSDGWLWRDTILSLTQTSLHFCPFICNWGLNLIQPYWPRLGTWITRDISKV